MRRRPGLWRGLLAAVLIAATLRASRAPCPGDGVGCLSGTDSGLSTMIAEVKPAPPHAYDRTPP
jgi:hypothetical protein